MSFSDDEDMRRAIALSLQEISSPPSQSRAHVPIIDLTSDDEDDDLDAPVHIKEPTSSRQPAQKKGSHASVADKRESKHIDIAEKEDEGLPKTQSSSNVDPFLILDSLSKPQPPSLGSAMLGLDRMQMEANRLARIEEKKKRADEVSSGFNDSRKRKASTSETLCRSQGGREVKLEYPGSSQVKKEDGETLKTSLQAALTSGFQGPDKPLMFSSHSLSHRETIPSTGASQASAAVNRHTTPEILSFKQQQALQAPGVKYPDGVVKRTWAKGYPQEEDMVRVEDVFQKDDLELAVLSTFQVDPNWVSTKLSDKTKVIWVLSARDEDEKRELQYGAIENYRFCFPSLEGNINMMHSKLQLLAHPTHLRIVVTSANLVPYDWGESGVMENVCFLIDLPRLAEDKATDPGVTSEFGKELLRFVTAWGLDTKVCRSMSKFDFTRTSKIRFVHSIGGSHSGPDWKLTGYCGLGTAVRSLGFGTDEKLSIDIVVSILSYALLIVSRETESLLTDINAASIGSLTEGFVKSIYLAAQGDDGWTEYSCRVGNPTRRKPGSETSDQRKLADSLKDCFRIYFPTQETVEESKGGIGAAGTICFQSKWYDSNTFPRHLMRDCKGHRGMLMHNKMIFVQPDGPNKQGRAWAYVGSANLSESAWGRLVKDKTTKEPKLLCRNWECGVIFPVPAAAGSGKSVPNGIGGGSRGLEIFRGHVPVPMIVPGERYGKKRPWFF